MGRRPKVMVARPGNSPPQVGRGPCCRPPREVPGPRGTAAAGSILRHNPRLLLTGACGGARAGGLLSAPPPVVRAAGGGGARPGVVFFVWGRGAPPHAPAAEAQGVR